MRAFTTQLIRQLSAAADHRTDGDLLGGFLTRNVEADFAELVRRHGSMVWGVCRRCLPDRADAEDAFQTVFLVLVRRRNSLVGLGTVGPWLHRVATWTARNVRRRNAHRLAKRATLTEELPAATTDRDLSLDLDNALLALPEKFRSSIVLCHLLGFSRADAAAQLGCPEGTLSAWLSRGLAKLRTKLGDLDPARPLGCAAVLLPAGLSGSVLRAAVACRATAATTMASVLSSAVPQLIEGVIRMFWVKKATAATFALFTVFAFGVGIGLSTHRLAPVSGGQDNPALPKVGAPTESTEELDVAIEEPDLNAILADLEEQLRLTEKTRNAAADRATLVRSHIAAFKFAATQQQKPTDPKVIHDMEDKVARFVDDFDVATKKRDELKKTIAALREYLSKQEKTAALRAALKLKLKPNPQENPLKVIRLKNVLAEDAAKTITEIFNGPQQRGGGGPAAPAGVNTNRIRVVAEKSSNSLIVIKASPVDLVTIEKLLADYIDFGDDVDKKLLELKKRQAELEAETEASKRKQVTLEAEQRKIEEELRDLQKLKNLQKLKEANPKGPALTNATGAYFQLTVGTKDAAWPYLVKEFGPDGKLIGTTAFENAAVLGRFFTRAMKDSTAPKEVRITAQANTPWEMLTSALDACKSAGVGQPLLKIGNEDLVADQIARGLDALLREKVIKERAAVKEEAELKMLEMKRQEDLERKVAERRYAEAIRRAKELLDKQKPDQPPTPLKP